MVKLLETIKIIEGNPQFLAFHQERVNHSQNALFNHFEKIELKQVIKNPPAQGIFRCRIVYANSIDSIEYIPYFDRQFKTFKIVENNDISYNFKYLDRSSIDTLLKSKGKADDILIIKQGFITDTSIANVAFFVENRWITPNTPLLKGTTRERLLQSGKILEKSIKINDLHYFSKMAILNALIGFYEIQHFECID